MPGPVPQSITGFNGGAMNVVRAEPECMAHIAAVAIGWTQVEESLISMMFGALGAANFQSETVVGMSGNWVARVAMQQAETIRTRIKLVDATIKPLLKGTNLDDRWERIRLELQKSARRRNEILHTHWRYSTELPGYVIKLKPSGPEKWSVDDFRTVMTGCFKLNQAIAQLTHDIGAANARGLLPMQQSGSAASAAIGLPERKALVE